MVEHDRHEEAEQSLRKLYSDEEEELIIRTQIEIREQIQLEAAQRQHKNLGHALIELFTWKNIRRTAMAIMVMQLGILSGSLAIQNYQSLLYASLGYHDRSAILISGCYGFMGIVGQAINLLGVSDKWSRKRTMCTSYLPTPFHHKADNYHRARLSHSSNHALHPHGSVQVLRLGDQRQRGARRRGLYLPLLRPIRHVLQFHPLHHRR